MKIIFIFYNKTLFKVYLLQLTQKILQQITTTLFYFKPKQKLFLSFIFSLIICKSFGQIAKTNKNKIIFSPGLSYQRTLFAEINLMYIDDEATKGGPCNGGIAAGTRVGMEINVTGKDRMIAPKIGYELSGSLLCMRINSIYYIKNNEKDLRLLPEIGFSLGGAINLTYGYGFSVLNQKISQISKSRVTLTFNLHKNLWQQL